MNLPESHDILAHGLRKNRTYATISIDLLARCMCFSRTTLLKYIRQGLLPSVDYGGKRWVVQPGQRWSVLQILKEGYRMADGKPPKILCSVPYLDSKAVAEILDVSMRRVQKLAAEGYLPSLRLNPNGPFRFSVTDIVRYKRRCIRGMTPAKVGQARAQLEVIRRLARRRLR